MTSNKRVIKISTSDVPKKFFKDVFKMDFYIYKKTVYFDLLIFCVLI